MSQHSHSPDLDRTGQLEMPGVAPQINRGGNQCINDSRTQLLNHALDNTDTLFVPSGDPKTHPSPTRSERSSKRRLKSEDSLDLEEEVSKNYKDVVFEQINKKEDERRLDAPFSQSLDYNPMKHMKHFEKSEAQYNIESNSITPFDQSHFIQTIFNPITIDRDHPELITVQVIYPMLSELTPEKANRIAEEDLNAARSNYQGKCPKDRNLIEQTLLKRTECTYCAKEVPAGETMYSSVVSETFQVCVECNLKHYTRTQLKHQNSNHSVFEQYELAAVGSANQDPNQQSSANRPDKSEQEKKMRKEPLNQLGTGSDQVVSDADQEELCVKAQQQNRMKEEALTKRLKEIEINFNKQQYSTIHRFATVEREDTQDIKKDNNAQAKFCLVALWKFENDQYRAYRMFKVENPAFQEVKFHENQTAREFIQVGENNELFYFTKTRAKGIPSTHILNIFDTQTAMNCKDSELRRITSTLFAPPTVKQIEFHQTHQSYELFNRFLSTRGRLIASTHMKLYTVSGTQLLAVVLPYAQCINPNTRASEWVRTEQMSNAHFIDLSSKQVAFTIYGADLLFEVQVENREPKHVTFLRANQVIVMKWNSQISAQEQSKSFITSHRIPDQPSKQIFEIMPSQDANYFIGEAAHLKATLATYNQNKAFLYGALHADGKKVSICYQNQALYVFNLHEEVSHEHATQWRGVIGDDNDFAIDNMKIDSERKKIVGFGKHGKLDRFAVTGELGLPSERWNLNIEQLGKITQMNLRSFEFDETTGEIQGEGDFGGKGFEIKGNFQSKHSIEFSLRFRSDTTYTYNGQLNEARTAIVGTYKQFGNDTSENNQKFSMTLSKNLVNCELKIEFLRKNYGALKLNGTYSHDEKEIKGKFKVVVETQNVTVASSFLSNASSKNYFIISGVNCKARAECAFQSSSMADARLFNMTKKDNTKNLMACGNLRLKEKTEKQMEGYQIVQFDLINLESNDYKRETLVCQIPRSFKQYKDNQGLLKLPPYKLFPFKVKDDEMHSFKTQIYFTDFQANLNKLIFLQGQQKLSADEIKLNKQMQVLPQWPSVMAENFICQYPILAYKSNAPTDNEILIVNLVQNQPQKLINIAPFKFIQFVDSGMLPEKFFNEKMTLNTSIFLLVQKDQKIYLMNYRCFPWPIDPRLILPFQKDRFQLQDELSLVTGAIDLAHHADHIHPTRLTAEKIHKACMIQRPQGDGSQICIVLQLLTEIVAFNLKLDNFFERSQDSGNTMLPISFQKGPSDQVYVAMNDDEGSSLIYQITYVEKNRTTWSEVHRSDNASIVAFQVSYVETQEKHTINPVHAIYVLQSDGVYKKLQIQTTSRDECEIMLKFELNLIYQPGVKALLAKVQHQNWSQMLLENDVIYGLIQSEKTLTSNINIMNVRSKTTSHYEYLGFDHDRIRDRIVLDASMTELRNTVHSITPVPWINKNIYEVKESKMSYFVIQQSVSTRKIDYMRIDTALSLRQDQLLIGNSYVAIALRFTQQYMLFRQRDHTFCHTLPFPEMRKLTNCVDGAQYFQVRVEDTWNRVIQVDKDGKFYPKYQTIVQERNILFDEYLDDLIDREDYEESKWSLCQDDDRLLGLFAFKYHKTPETSQGHAERTNNKLSGADIPIKILIVNRGIVKKTKTIDLRSSVGFQSIFNFNVTGLSDVDDHKRQYLDFCAKSGYLPTLFFIQSDRLSKLKPHKVENQTRQTLFTQNFLVIKHGLQIVYGKLDQIFKVNIAALKELKLGELIDPKFFRKKLESNDMLLYFKTIDLAVLQDSLTERDFKISNVATIDLNMAEKAEDRTNVIQITFPGVAILWDLDENKEVQFIWKQSQFAHHDQFVPTGFTLHRFLSPERKLMQETADFTQNEDRSMIMSPRTETTESHIFRTFTGLNILDLKALKKNIDQGLHTDMIDYNTFLTNINNLTFFQVFKTKPEFLELLEKMVLNDDLSELINIDEFGEVSDNIIIRKLYWSLSLNVIPEKVNDLCRQSVKHPSILHCTLFDEENMQMLDPLLRIIMLSEESRLSDLVGTFSCFKKAFDIESSEINNFLSNSYFQNSECLEIDSLMWKPGCNMLTFGSNNSIMSKEQIEKQVREEQFSKRPWNEKLISKFTSNNITGTHLKTYPVTVRIMEIEWVGDKLKEFFTYLNKIDDNTLFSNEFIKVLLEQQYYSNQLFVKVLLPYAIYIALCLIYFSSFVPYTRPQCGFFGCDGELEQASYRVVICLGALTFNMIELRQMYLARLQYFRDIWNYLYWASNFVAIFIVIQHSTRVFDVSDFTLIEIASIEIFMQWGFAFYWMRLSPDLAFYVNMIIQTLYDCAYFIIIFLVSVLMFGNAYYALQGIPSQPNEDGSEYVIWPKAFEQPFVDSVFSNFMIGLGEFVYDGWSDHPARVVIWIYFILSTFFTQIMFLNMLIAIMGTTYERVMESKERASLMERTHLYADWLWAIRLTKELEGQRYLYVIRPKTEEDEESESAIDLAKKNIVKIVKERDDAQRKEVEILRNQVHRLLQKQNKLETTLQKMFDKQMEQVKDALNKK